MQNQRVQGVLIQIITGRLYTPSPILSNIRVAEQIQYPSISYRINQKYLPSYEARC